MCKLLAPRRAVACNGAVRAMMSVAPGPGHRIRGPGATSRSRAPRRLPVGLFL